MKYLLYLQVKIKKQLVRSYHSGIEAQRYSSGLYSKVEAPRTYVAHIVALLSDIQLPRLFFGKLWLCNRASSKGRKSSDDRARNKSYSINLICLSAFHTLCNFCNNKLEINGTTKMQEKKQSHLCARFLLIITQW